MFFVWRYRPYVLSVLLLLFVSFLQAAPQQINTQLQLQHSKPLSDSDQSDSNLFRSSEKREIDLVKLSAEETKWLNNHLLIIVGGGPDWAPFDFVADDGSYQGFANDYLNLITSKTGLKFKVVIDQWSHHLHNIQDKKIDVLGAAYYSKERSEFLNYSTPYIEVLDYFFIRDDLAVKTLDDLNGKRVAIPKDYAHGEILKKYFPKIQIVTVDTFGAAIDAVLENRADMLYDNYAALSYVFNKEGINTIIPFKSTRDKGTNPIHIVSRKDAPELASIIQKGLDAISVEERQTIYNKWLGKRFKDINQKITLNKAEQQWLKNHPIIRFGIDPSWPPYEFIDQSGRYKGISAEVINLLQQRLGISFKLSTYQSWAETLEKAKNRDIELLSCVTKTSNREKYLRFSNPFFTPLIGIYTRKDRTNISSLGDLKNKTVVIEKMYFLHEHLAKEYPDIKLLLVSTTAEALKILSYGQADAYVGNQGAANWIAEKNGMNNLKIIAETNLDETPLRLAVRGDWVLFHGILNKALSSITDAEMASIRRKWLGLSYREEKKLSLSESEQRWLDEHKLIRFAGDPNWLPYEAFDKQGNYIGIVAEHLKLIEQQLGIKVKIIATRSWSDSVAKVKRGEIDVLSETSDSDLKSQLTFTQPYISSPVVIIMKNDEDYVESIEQIKHRKIAVIKEYGYVPEIIKKYPNLPFHHVETIQNGLTSVSTGKVDALLATLAQASYHISELGINNIRIVGKTEFNTQLAFGMRKEFTPLTALFNRALNTISQQKKQQIFDAWGKHKYAEKIDYGLLLQIAAVFLIIIAIIGYWNRKLAKEIALRKEIEAQTMTLIETIPLQIVVSNSKGKILTANSKALADYKIHKDDIDDFEMTDFYHDLNDRDEVVKELAETGKVDQKIIQFKRLDGAVRSMMISVMPVLYHKQNAFLTIAVDMTDRLEMEASLLEAKEQADAANKAKSEFLANMSHEIRTPMNAIIGFTELLSEQIEEPRLKSFVKIIQSAGNSLLVLINDILDLSKIEAGKLQIEKTACNPHDLLTELGDIFLIKMREKNIDFLLDIDPKIPHSLQIDGTRLRQVLFNLIGNAVKFTDNGFVRVKAYITNVDKIRSKLEFLIEVEDSGIGISENQLQLIFQAFEQSPGQNIKQYGGTGLGLSISKRLIEMMGGEITVCSQKNEGSTFTIKLKEVDVAPLIVEKDNEKTRSARHIHFFPSKILIVDDVEDNRQLLLANFADSQLLVEIAENGLQAVDIVKQHMDKQQPFDLVLMDIQMPVMDGYQAAKAIKDFTNIPIIALTASVLTEEFERIKSHNFQGYLRKPILKKDLMNELSRFLPFTEDIENDVLDNQSKIAFLSVEELSYLPQLLIQLKSLLPHCQEISVSNNISEIKRFANVVLATKQHYPVASVIDYSNSLSRYIDCFDIVSIKQTLNEYPRLISQLEKQISYLPSNENDLRLDLKR